MIYFFRQNIRCKGSMKINETIVNNSTQVISNTKMNQMLDKMKPGNAGKDGSKVWEFDKPEPWSKIILLNNAEYPYLFHIKINYFIVGFLLTIVAKISNKDFKSLV